MNYDIGPYEPCPCGSGAKYKFCCADKAKTNRRGKFPIGTVAYYGPDDKMTTKIAAGVILRDRAEPVLERWVGTNVAGDAKIRDLIKRFFARHGVKSVVMSSGNLGCPHEEGIDFPRGHDCPFCPFWAGKQGSGRRDDLDDWLTDEEVDAYEQEDEDADVDAFDDEAAEEEDWEEERDWDAAFARVEAILGDRELDCGEVLDVLFAHLQANLHLPSEVTGVEDFRWEEPYVFGGWSPQEYKRLKQTQPSYEDRYELLGIDREACSEWMMFDEDIAAHVRRISDGKEFILGLAELKATQKDLPDHQLLDDYAVWFVNNR